MDDSRGPEAYANGGMEVWAGALQIASDVHTEFRRAGDETVIKGNEIVSSIEVTPAYISRMYTGPDFSVIEQISVPLDQRAVLFPLYRAELESGAGAREIRSVVESHVAGGTGGQEIRWDQRSGYLLTDAGREFAAIALAPGATAHDEPLNRTRDPQNGELAIALDPRTPQVLFAEVNPHPRERELDILAAERLLQASSTWQQQNAKHYQDVLASDVGFETPDEQLNRALAWAEIALDQNWFCNDALGCGYVAGYGPSRRGRRPQYAWFFSGDGMVAMHGALAVGDLEQAREEIRFIAKYQDPQSGMIWHEITQSAPYLDWRGKYPYMFVHADLTYPYISAVADYIRASNDRAFLQEIWPSVQKAFAYGRSLVDADGLPKIPEGKEGANEQNPLREELGLSAGWVEACGDYAHLAELEGQSEAAHEAHELAAKARTNFAQRYWDRERNFAIQGYQRNGEKTLARGLGAIAAVNDGLFSDEQGAHVLDQIASWRFQSDWGTRSVAVGEPGYDPTGYAHGSVWGISTADVAQACWAAHRPDIAWQVWRTLIPWSSSIHLGIWMKCWRATHTIRSWSPCRSRAGHRRRFFRRPCEVFSDWRLMSRRSSLTLAPHLPADWDHASLRRIRVGNATLDFSFRQTMDALTLNVEK